jgi:translocation and assembly module TamB
MRRSKKILLTLAVLLLMPIGVCVWAFFADWGGAFLLSILETNIRGKITAKTVSGNLIRGVTYLDLVITGPDGRVFLQADQAVFRVSLWSIPALHLDIAEFGLKNSNIQLIKRESGRWNFSDLLKPAGQKPPPTPKGQTPPAPGLMARIKKFVFRQVNFDYVWTENGKISVTQVGVATIYSDIDLKSKYTIYDWGEQNQKITVNNANLGVTAPQGRVELETNLTYSSGLTKIDSLNLKLANRTILSMKGELCKPLQDLTCNFSGKVGPVNGALIHEFWPQWPVPWDLTGKFSFSSTPEGANLESKGKIGQADYKVKGDLNAKVKPEVFNLDLDLKGLSTAQLKGVKNLNVQSIQGLSPVDAHLQVKGTGLPWNPESLVIHLELEPFRYKDLKVEKAQLDLSGNARTQKLQVGVAGNFGTVAIKADGHLLPLGKDAGVHGNLTVQTGDLKPAMLGIADLAGTTLTSCFIGKFRLPPGLSTSQLHLAGDLTATGQVKNQPVKDLQARFVLEGRKLTIANADIQAAGIVASLQGTVSESGLDLTFTATTSGSRALPLPSGSSFSSLRIQGSVRGPFKAPQINLAGQARNVAFNGTTLQSATLCADLSGLPPQSGTILLEGMQIHTKAGDFSRVTLQARGTGGQWQFQMAGTSPKEPKFELAGTADLKGRPLTIDINKVSWQSQNLKLKNKTPFQVRLFPGYEITPATFLVDGGTVGLQMLVRGGELSGNIKVQELNASLLAPLGLPATGKFSGQATLAGTPAAPTLTAQLSLSGGQVNNIPIQTLTTTLNYQSGEMQVAGYLQAGPQNSRLVWKGVVPVSLSLIPFKFALADRGLDLKIQSENVSLSLLTLFTKEVQCADSKVDAVVQVQGNPHKPQVTGYIRWTAGMVLIRQAGTPYTLEAGEIRLQGDKITIPGIVLVSQGTARFSGEVIMTEGGRTRMAARLDNFLALNRGGNDLYASGQVDLVGPFNALVAKGHLTVPRANFRPTFFQTGRDPDIILVRQEGTPKGKKTAPSSIYNNMTIDVSLDAARGVWLKDPMGKVELAAHLKAKKTPGRELALGGQIRSLHGSLDVEGKEFKVERAILTLPGDPGKPILVDAKATHPVEDADIMIVVTVTGTLANPRINLESLPPLPPTDVLSFLVFGAPAATLSRDQYLAFAAQYGLLGGGGANRLGEILGSTIPFLSGIKMKTGLVSGRPTVGVEKEVVKNVSVFVSRNLNEERGVYENQVGIQYKINRNLSIESQVGTRNTGADVYFNYDF